MSLFQLAPSSGGSLMVRPKIGKLEVEAPPPQEGDEPLLTALACGATVEAAAAKAGMSRATAYRRLQDPSLRLRLKELRSEMVSRATALLTAASSEAVKTLLLLLGSAHSSTARLGA